MCGRYALTTPPAVLAALRSLQHVRFDLVPRFNIAPTQRVPGVRIAEDGGQEMVGLHWGLIPMWAKDRTIGSRMINARSETAAEKPAFRHAFKRRRCVLPASGFYEWRKLSARQKQPYYIHRADDAPLAFAGLWERWSDKESGEIVESCTIVTTDANDMLRPVHDRMPVILDAGDFDQWLDPECEDASLLKPLLVPVDDDVLTAEPVSRRVNSPKNDDPSLIEPVEAAALRPDDQSPPGLFSA